MSIFDHLLAQPDQLQIGNDLSRVLTAMQWQEDSNAAIAKAVQEREFQGKYRHQFFQTPTAVEVNVLAKNLSPDRVTVSIQEQRLRVITKNADGEQDYELDVPLYGEVHIGPMRAAVGPNMPALILRQQ